MITASFWRGIKVFHGSIVGSCAISSGDSFQGLERNEKEPSMKPLQTLVFSMVAVWLTTTIVEVKGGAATTTNVTSQLLVPSDSVAPVFFSDAGQSTTNTYVTTAGKSPVSSILQPGGDWQLDTTSAARAVWLDLGDASQPFNAQYVHSLLTTHCGITGTTPVASLAGVGSATVCPMSFRINWGSDGSVFYRIHFNSINHPGTGDVRFTCNQVALNNGCIDWSARPADDDSLPGDGRSGGELMKVTTAKNGTETETLIGYYQMNFQIHITKP
jgi:hypothetical protein